MQALYLVGAPCLLTSLTTAVGFLALRVSPIVAISHMAVYSAMGVVVAFALTMTLVPALLSFGSATPRARAARIRARRRGSCDGLEAVAAWNVRNRRARAGRIRGDLAARGSRHRAPARRFELARRLLRTRPAQGRHGPDRRGDGRDEQPRLRVRHGARGRHPRSRGAARDRAPAARSRTPRLPGEEGLFDRRHREGLEPVVPRGRSGLLRDSR